MKLPAPPWIRPLRSIVAASVLFLVGGGSLQVGHATKPAPDNDEEVPAWVAGRVASLQPRPEEKRLDEIGWSDDIRQALRLAKEHRRPVFLFTHDGRINLGRC